MNKKKFFSPFTLSKTLVKSKWLEYIGKSRQIFINRLGRVYISLEKVSKLSEISKSYILTSA